MAKVEELNKSMAPVHSLGDQLKELKKLLEAMENAAGINQSASSSMVAKLKKASSKSS